MGHLLRPALHASWCFAHCIASPPEVHEGLEVSPFHACLWVAAVVPVGPLAELANTHGGGSGCPACCGWGRCGGGEGEGRCGWCSGTFHDLSDDGAVFPAHRHQAGAQPISRVVDDIFIPVNSPLVGAGAGLETVGALDSSRGAIAALAVLGRGDVCSNFIVVVLLVVAATLGHAAHLLLVEEWFAGRALGVAAFQAGQVHQAATAGVAAGLQAGGPTGFVMPLTLSVRIVVVTEQGADFRRPPGHAHAHVAAGLGVGSHGGAETLAVPA